MSTREYFWTVWGAVQHLTCARCRVVFCIRDVHQCSKHADDPVFQSAYGTWLYPCCGVRALAGAPAPPGCVRCDHALKDPSPEARALLDLARRFDALAIRPYQPLAALGPTVARATLESTMPPPAAAPRIRASSASTPLRPSAENGTFPPSSPAPSSGRSTPRGFSSRPGTASSSSSATAGVVTPRLSASRAALVRPPSAARDIPSLNVAAIARGEAAAAAAAAAAGVMPNMPPETAHARMLREARNALRMVREEAVGHSRVQDDELASVASSDILADGAEEAPDGEAAAAGGGGHGSPGSPGLLHPSHHHARPPVQRLAPSEPSNPASIIPPASPSAAARALSEFEQIMGGVLKSAAAGTGGSTALLRDVLSMHEGNKMHQLTKQLASLRGTYDPAAAPRPPPMPPGMEAAAGPGGMHLQMSGGNGAAQGERPPSRSGRMVGPPPPGSSGGRMQRSLSNPRDRDVAMRRKLQGLYA